MKGMIFKKTVLLGGFFLLATLMSIQLSWSCDDDDKWDHDCHDKWHCDHYGKPCDPPKIQRVFLDYNPDPETFIRFSIWGKNFDNGASPVVTLGGEFDLTVGDRSDDYMVATLPKSEEQGFEFGDYRLVVSTCQDSRCKYCEDYCSKCKDKHCRDYCSKCKDRYCKNKYCNDDKHKCKCKDRYSLTIPGPSTPPGTIALKIESITIDLPSSEATQKIVAQVRCEGGLGVTGGGFSCSNTDACADGLRIVANEPLQDDKNNGIGWRIIATWPPQPTAQLPVQLTIRAICAQAQ
jgi:hypothetical protein